MILDTLSELSLWGVYDRGVPNKERIVFRANHDVNLGQFGIMLGLKNPATGTAFPMRDNLFWLGDINIEDNDWVYIYTGSGEGRTIKTNDEQNSMYIGHWGKTHTVLADHTIVPILFKVDAVVLPDTPTNLPQYPSLSGK